MKRNNLIIIKEESKNYEFKIENIKNEKILINIFKGN